MTENKKYWFKNKKYGWGWYPATIEGWICIALFIASLFITGIIVQSFTNNEAMFAAIYSTLILIQAGILVFVSYKKGEKPRWSWGDKK